MSYGLRHSRPFYQAAVGGPTTHAAVASLAGECSVTGTIQRDRPTTATLVGTTLVTGAVTEGVLHLPTAGLVGTTEVTAVVNTTASVTAALAGATSTSATIQRTHAASISIVGVTSVTGLISTGAQQAGVASLAGLCAVTATIQRVRSATATLSGLTAVTGTIQRTQLATASLIGATTVTAAIQRQLGTVATLTGTCSVTGVVQESAAHQATITLVGTCSVTAIVSHDLRATITLVGTCLVVGSIRRQQQSTAALAGFTAVAATLGGILFEPFLGSAYIIHEISPTQYVGGAQFFLEACGRTLNGLLFFRLFNITDGGAVAGSEISTGSSAIDRISSSAFTLPSSAKEYRVEVANDPPTFGRPKSADVRVEVS